MHHGSFLSSDNDADLEDFCKLEEALQSDSEDEKVDDINPDNLRAELRSKFPGLFEQHDPRYETDPKPEIDSPPAKKTKSVVKKPEKIVEEDEYDHILELTKNLHENYESLKKKRYELERDQKRFQRERKAFAKERAKFESEQIFANSKPGDSQLKEKYDRLKSKYDQKKKEWSCEKTMLLGQIEDLRRALRAKDVNPAILVSKPEPPSNNNNTNSIVEIDDDSESSGIERKEPEIPVHAADPVFSDIKIDSESDVEIDQHAFVPQVKVVQHNVFDGFIKPNIPGDDSDDVDFVQEDTLPAPVIQTFVSKDSVVVDDSFTSKSKQFKPLSNSRLSPAKNIEYPQIKRNVIKTKDSFEIIDEPQQQPVKVIRANIGSPIKSPPKVKAQQNITPKKQNVSKLSPKLAEKKKISSPEKPVVQPPVIAKEEDDDEMPPLHDDYDINFDFDLGPVLREIPGANGKRTLRYSDGTTATVFSNGTKKMTRNGCTYVFYANGDVSQEFKDKAIAYKYAETGTVELTLPDQTVFYSFVNKQREKHFPNGDKVIQYPNGTLRINYVDGNYEIHHTDGKIEICTDGKITYE